ncbi:MAG: MFS transporter [Ignavibacteriales bacterium]|nr:MFS transporter [Ignavibacteriales bacterium]
MKNLLKITANGLSINRNVAVLGGSLFGLGLGEELWMAYLPLYLSALGASGFVVGLAFSFRDFLDGIYQYPGGWINDRFGRKRALMLFTLLAMSGYAVMALAAHWGVVFVGIFLVMAWKAGAFPTTFAVIGEALPAGKRGTAFSVQSMLVRVPRIIAAPLGGLLIGAVGVVSGVRTALGMTLLIAAAAIVIQQRGYQERSIGKAEFHETSAREIFKHMPGGLKRLLLAECFVRIGEGIAGAFIALYVVTVQGFSPGVFGMVYAFQQMISIALYLPAGKLADFQGRQLPITLTFIAFAVFPLAIYFADSMSLLILAFLIGGLKEFGEPARKSLITDLADPARMGRSVGIYYTIRNLLVVPAGALGGFLWQYSVELPFLVACAVGLLGVLLYIVTSKSKAVY